MYIIELNENQLKNMLELLDGALKTGGLSSLAAVVDLHNAVVSAKKVEELPSEDNNNVEKDANS